MASFLVRNSLNPQKVVKLSVTFQQVVLKDNEGEHFWLVEVATDEPHKDGGEIGSEYIHLTSLDNLDAEIEKVSAKISDQVDWEPLIGDTRAPFVFKHSPSETVGVDINSSVKVTIKELLPSSGVDKDSIKVMLNDFDITNEAKISGDPYEYKIKWRPSIVVYDTYE